MDQTTRDSYPQHGSVPRRRVVQACSTCRGRKIRCDAGVPKCSLCVDLKVDCVYLDSQYTKIDAGTRIVLERIQRLEDRLLSSTSQTSVTSTAVDPGPLPIPFNQHGTSPVSSLEWTSNFGFGGDDSLLTLPARHDANADHVYRWAILQEIINRGATKTADLEWQSTMPKFRDATDIFLVELPRHSSNIGTNSWRIFEHSSLQYFSHQAPQTGSLNFEEMLHEYTHLLHEFFTNIHSFYPIIRSEQVHKTLVTAFQSAVDQQSVQDERTLSDYCVLLMVLCLGALAMSGNVLLSEVPLKSHDSSQKLREKMRPISAKDKSPVLNSTNSLEDHLWSKAQLLLGAVSLEDTLEAAQCFTLASVYLGAKGRTVDSDHNIHVAARKCKLIARRAILTKKEDTDFSDSFRRLFWVVYINESDFSSEFSLTPPSGMALLEDIVPYPSPDEADTEMGDDLGLNQHTILDSFPNSRSYDNFSAFQVSTSSAIRRFINRTTAVLYNSDEAWRKENHTTYATWLHKLASELRSHHEAIHESVPSFLLSTDPTDFWRQINIDETTSADPMNQSRFANHLWNVARLRGRYFAGLYIINRPLFEYVLLNQQLIDTHTSKTAILNSCRECLAGCSSFIETFFSEPLNCLTNLFATGMATFTMVIILMISTTVPLFYPLLPAKIEDIIAMGRQNVRRFSTCIKEFRWHDAELEKLDKARNKINHPDA